MCALARIQARMARGCLRVAEVELSFIVKAGDVAADAFDVPLESLQSVANALSIRRSWWGGVGEAVDSAAALGTLSSCGEAARG